MKIQMQWTQGLRLEAESDSNKVAMDAKAPIGQGSAMTPKELVGAGLGGCTAMDVIALFKKHKQNPTSFGIDVDIEHSSGGHPAVFTKAVLTYKAQGQVEKQVFIDSVVASQTKYCGVSAMLSKAFPIFYKIELNGELISQGQAHF